MKRSLLVLFCIFSTLSAKAPFLAFEKLYETDFEGKTYGMAETYDNGFLLAGDNTPGDGNRYAFVIRTDSLGNTVWEKNLGRAWNSIQTNVSAHDIVNAANNSYIIVGQGNSKATNTPATDIDIAMQCGYISKIDDSGTVIWEKYIHPDDDYRNSFGFYGIDKLNNDNYVVGGYHAIGDGSVENPPRWNGYIIIINENGDVLNEISFETTDTPSLDWFYDIKATADNGFVATGFYSNDLTPGYTPFGLVVKFDQNRKKAWHYIYQSEKMTTLRSIAEMANENIVAAGAVQNDLTSGSLLLFQLSQNGTALDTLVLDQYDHFGAMDVQACDNGFIAAGYAYNNTSEPRWSKPCLLKFDETLNVQWNVLAGTHDWGEGWTSLVTSDGNFAVSGMQITFKSDTSFTQYAFLSKIKKTATKVAGTKPPYEFSLGQNYPNPFNPVTTIAYEIPSTGLVKLAVYNVLGEQVAELVNGSQNAGVHAIRFDASHLANGSYLYRLEYGDKVLIKKLLLLK